jgi:VWFA-related protein
MPMNTTNQFKLASLLTVSVLAAAHFLSPFPAAAQSPAGPIPPKSGAGVQKAPDSLNIRVKVDLVNAPVVVNDAKGEMILDLTQKNFRVFDNGIEQKIEAFDMGGAPLSAAIVVETSSRIEAFLPTIRKTGILFTQTVLGPDGDATVIGFNDSVDQLLDFTGNHDTIEKSFADLREGTSGAKLYDALSQAVGRLRSRPASRRRVLIVLAEASDSGSENKLGQVLREAQLANITVYSVALSPTAAALRGPEKQAAPPSATPPGTFGLPPIPGTPQTPETEQTRNGNIDLLGLATWTVQHATASVREHPLEIATTATGGLYQTAFHDSAIETAIDRIGGELHAEYTLSYHPAGTDPTGYHEIKVQVDRPGLKVRSRPGYFLTPPEA